MGQDKAANIFTDSEGVGHRKCLGIQKPYPHSAVGWDTISGLNLCIAYIFHRIAIEGRLPQLGAQINAKRMRQKLNT